MLFQVEIILFFKEDQLPRHMTWKEFIEDS